LDNVSLIRLPKQPMNLILYLLCVAFQICISDSVQMSTLRGERDSRKGLQALKVVKTETSSDGF